MNWRNSFDHVDKVRAVVYFVMALFFIGLGLHLGNGLRRGADENPERTIEASYSSPDGRHWLLHFDVYQQLLISLINWSELEIVSAAKPDERVLALKFIGRVYDLRWLDHERVRITLENTVVIAARVREYDGVRFEIEFKPNDPVKRREELIGRKTPKEQWGNYDVETD